MANGTNQNIFHAMIKKKKLKTKQKHKNMIETFYKALHPKEMR